MLKEESFLWYLLRFCRLCIFRCEDCGGRWIYYKEDINKFRYCNKCKTEEMECYPLGNKEWQVIGTHLEKDK